jgi:uncharacterized protein (DUF305 family)
MNRLWQRPALLVAITAVLMLGAGIAVGWVAASSTPGNDSAEAGFARDMQTHHAQAVQMAMHQWQAGEDEALRSIAYDIATAQQAEIGMMQTWLRDWGAELSSSEPMAWAGGHDHGDGDGGRLMAGMATQEQINEFLSLEGREADVMFAELMIEHHIGGIDMAETVLDLSNHPEVVDAAWRMVYVQRGEIEVMELHLARLTGSTG